MGLDELRPRRDGITHQHVERAVRRGCVIDGHLQQDAVFGVHGGIPEQFGVHLAKTLVAGNGGFLGSRSHFLEQRILLAIGVGISGGIFVGDAVERRLGDEEMPLFDQFLHVAEEKGEQQRADVRAIHIGIRHEDHLAVAEVGDVEIVADAGAQRGDDRFDLLVAQHFVQPGAFGVEDLAAQWKDRLKMPVASLFGRAAGGFAFDDVEFGLLRCRARSNPPVYRAG